MKYLILILIIFLNGCLYINERGVSTYLYDKCNEYYDANGTYHKECGQTLSDDTIKGIKSVVSSVTKTISPKKTQNTTKSSAKEVVYVEDDMVNIKKDVKVAKKRKRKCKCRCKKKRKCVKKNR